jgi:3-oxoadipate enol-lactonase / 4-carboxymuconolactone decarboxylase
MTAVVPHYVVAGRDDAPALVLSNSLGTDLHLWDWQMPALADHFRVIRYDQRGHGQTPFDGHAVTIDDLAADVIALLDHLGVVRASMAGLSLGGMTAMALARLVPDRVDRLVLCCTSARLGPPEMWHERAALVRDGGMAAVVDAVLARWFTPAFAARDQRAIARVRDMLLGTDPVGYAACCEAIAGMDQLDALASVVAPTLVIAGDKDPATPPEHGAAIAGAIRGARLVTIPGVAHLANVEAPAVMTAAIIGHLAPDAVLDDAALALTGQRVRREVLGDAHVDAATSRATALTADFQRYITREAWGAVWGRPGLDRRTRSAITVAMLVALGHDDELAMHLKAARTNGLAVSEIREILLQTAVYCGVPAANHAYAIASEVLGHDVELALENDEGTS